VAQIGSAAFSGSTLGINISASANNGISANSGTGSPFDIGAIVILSTANKALTINNSSTTSNGVINFNGGVGLNGVIIDNQNTTNSLTITNGASCTLGVVLNNATNNIIKSAAGGITIGSIISGANPVEFQGSGTITLSATNTYSGNTTISSGTLSLSPAGSMSNSANITIASGATLNVSGRTNSLALGSAQVLLSSATGANSSATLTVSSTAGLTLGSGGLSFTAYGGGATSPLTVTGSSAGALALNSSPVTVTTTTALAAGTTYKLVAKSGSATGVSGTLGALTVSGSGLASGATGSLSVTNGELVLIVTAPTLTAVTLTNALTNTYGTASAGVSYTATGTALTGQITNTPASGWEVSTNSSTAGFTNGAIAVNTNTTVWVRTAATRAAGTNNSTAVVTLASSGATSRNVTTSASSNVVSQQGLTITASSDSKTYGGTKTYTSGSTNFTSSGLQNSETIGSVTIAASGGTATNSAVGSYPLTPSAATGGTFTAANYSITYNTNTLAVSAAPLTITGISISNKVYDRGTNATISGTATYSGLQNSESFTVTGTPSASFASSAVGTAKSVTVSGYTAPSANYSITQPSGLTANITVAPLTVTGAAATSRAYNATTNVTVTGGSLSGVITNDVVTLGGTPAGTVASAAVGTNKAVTVTGYSIGGADSGNYSLSQPTGLLVDITKATPTISVTGTTSFTYSGSPLGPDTSNVTGSTGVVSYSYVGTGETSYTASATRPTAAGSYTVTATVAADANFYGATSSVTAFTINAASLPLVTFTPPSLTYSGSAKTHGASATGPSGLTLTYTGRNATTYDSVTAPTNVGDYTVTATTSDGNYSGSQAQNFSITALGITGSFAVANKEYDGNTSATVTQRSLGGAVGGDAVSLSGGTATFDTAAVANGKTVTLAGASLAGAAASNYSLSSVSTTTANITAMQVNPDSITVTPPNLTYDGNAKAHTASRDGVSGFTYSYAGVSPTVYPASSTPPTNAGTYRVTVTPSDSNYSGSKSVDFTITKATPTISVTGATSFTYSGSSQGPGASTVTGSTGVVSYSYVGTGGTSYAASATQPTAAGSYTVTATVAADANYDTASSSAYAFTIRKADQTITGVAPTQSKIYGDYGGIYMDFDSTMTKGASTSALSYTSSNTNVATINPTTGSVHIVGAGTTILTVNQAADANYNAAPAVTQTLTVNRKAVTVTADAQTKAYGASDPALTYTSDGLVNGDALTGSLSRAGGTAVGTYAISQGTLTNPNYNISFTGADFTITAARLASSAITLTPAGDGSYTASATGVNGFSISYSGRTANGVVTSYGPSSSVPTQPGFYTVTATSTDGNYSGSSSINYFISGPVAVSDAVTKPAGNPSLVMTLASLLANDVRITPAGAVATDGLSITGVMNGSGNSAEIDGRDILFTPGGSSPETFTYVLGYGIQTAIGTVTVTTELSAPTFALQIAKVGTATYSAPNTTVAHDFTGVPNQTYAVEYSTDLTNWTSAGNPSTGATGSFSVTITKSGDVAADWNAHMFFRARLVR
jgi:hypothetical protein